MNIVAHIYDEEKSYDYYEINWVRLIFLIPFRLLWCILIWDWEDFHAIKHTHVMTFVGYIESPVYSFNQKTGVFFIRKLPTPCVVKKSWKNLSFQWWKKRLPLHKKNKSYTCWCTNEGDYVKYLSLKDVLDVNCTINLEKFLEISNQTEDEFMHRESIKYSGR